MIVPVCVSPSSPPLALLLWLSEEELEDVEDMRDLASRPSRTCPKSPLRVTSSSPSLLLLIPCTASRIQNIVRDASARRFSQKPRLLFWVCFHTWQRGGQRPVFSLAAEEHIQGLLVGDVCQIHLVQQVHVHLHGRDAANRSCGRGGGSGGMMCTWM